MLLCISDTEHKGKKRDFRCLFLEAHQSATFLYEILYDFIW